MSLEMQIVAHVAVDDAVPELLYAGGVVRLEL